MYWANFLHIYQPPTQSKEILTKAVKESYRPVLKIIKENRGGRLTLNINACLCDLLSRHGFFDVIDDIGALAQSGRIELTGSAKYHPILPLIPRSEIERQIELNRKSNERYFKGIYRPKGFFSPEMSYSKKVVRVVKEMGFEWMIIDEIGYNGTLGLYKKDRLYYINELEPFQVVFKERKVSAAISYGRCKNVKEFRRLNKAMANKNAYLLTGTDGEIYGHHLPGQERLLTEVFNDKSIKCCTISDLNRIFPKKEEVEPLSSSWSAWEDEMHQDIPYPQWCYPKNPIHKLLWALTMLTIRSVEKVGEQYHDDNNWHKARCILDEGLHSCQWWWASCRPWWGPRMIEKGVDILMRSLSTLEKCGLPKSVISHAFKLRKQITDRVTKWESSGKANYLQDEYLRSHKEVRSLLQFG